MHLDTHELAWAAGFFDGEGCTTTRLFGGTRKLTMHVVQVDRQSLFRFKAAVGGLGVIYGPYSGGPGGSKAISRWMSSRYEHSQAVIAMLWRYLGPVKRDQARNALLKYRSIPKVRGKDKTHCVMGHLYDERNTIWATGRGRQYRRCAICEKVWQAKSNRKASERRRLRRNGGSDELPLAM